MAAGLLTRRAAIQGAAGLATGVAAAAARPQGAFAHDHGHGRLPVPPDPIPGGIPISDTQVIHVWAPGRTDVTLPFSGSQLQGVDVEPTTIRDFDGVAAVAFHVGTATGSDGTRYDLETDVRAFRGTYIDRTGKRRFGSFGFIWIDLYVPGTGTPATQVHDFNGGILASGFFWTVPAREQDLRVSRDGRRAELELRDVPVVDSFQFFGPNQVPATVSLRSEWHAAGPAAHRGSGATVPPEDQAAFLGDIAPARSTIQCSGEEWGFSFTSDVAGTDRGYAQIGRTRNGVFL